MQIDPTRNNHNSRLRRDIGNQGFDDFTTMHRIREDQLPVMFEAIRKPGGMMPDPNNPGQQIRATGQNLTAHYQLKLCMMWFAVWYHWLVQRPFDPATVTLVDVQRLWEVKLSLDEHDNTAAIPPKKIESIKNMRDSIEDLNAYLNARQGHNKLPLAYVVRVVVALPGTVGTDAENENDPGIGQPDHHAEMIRRARHDDQS